MQKDTGFVAGVIEAGSTILRIRELSDMRSTKNRTRVCLIEQKDGAKYWLHINGYKEWL